MPSTDKAQRSIFVPNSKGTDSKDFPPAVSIHPGHTVDRNLVVRRTLLVPAEPLHVASSTPGSTSKRNLLGEIPLSSQHRKLSIKRKPLNLTQEDRELFTAGPSRHTRNPSTGTAGSEVSENGPDQAGLSFLQPIGRTISSIRTTSDQGSTAGASLYDLYQDDPSGLREILQSPSPSQGNVKQSHEAASTQAVEIW